MFFGIQFPQFPTKILGYLLFVYQVMVCIFLLYKINSTHIKYWSNYIK